LLGHIFSIVWAPKYLVALVERTESSMRLNTFTLGTDLPYIHSRQFLN